MYARVINNTIEQNFTLTAIKRLFPNVSFPANVTNEILAEYNFYPMESNYPEINTITQEYNEATYTFDGTKVTQTYSVVYKDIDVIKNYLKDIVKQNRKIAEEAGVILPNGHRVYTHREDQAIIQGLVLSLQLGLVETVNFKTMDGFLELDAQGVMDLAMRVAEHVQGAFTQEAELTAIINNATTIEELETIIESVKP